MEYSVALSSNRVVTVVVPSPESFMYANHTDHATLLKEWQRGNPSEYDLPPSRELEFQQWFFFDGCDIVSSISSDGEDYQISYAKR